MDLEEVAEKDFLIGKLRQRITDLEKSESRLKEMERELRENEKRFSDIAENAREWIWEVDAEGKYTYASPIVEKILGYAPGEMLVKHFFDPFHPEDREDLKKAAFEAFARKEPFREFINRNIHKNGETVWLSTSGVPIMDEDRNLFGYRGADTDITEYRRIKAEILRSQKIESLGILAGGIVHDFRNLLSGILGPVSAVKMELGPENPAFEMLTLAEEAGVLAKELIGRLLAFSNGGMPVRKAASISEVIHDSARIALSGSKTRCEITLPDALNPVEIDRGQMTQVFNNLMINASQAMPEGGIVRVFAENVGVEGNSPLPLRSGKYVKITVEDEGHGISRENLPKIFDPFFTTKEKGSGLGLSACYWIIRNHNGHITVESEPGGGTTFLVYLPLPRDVQAAP